MTKRLWLMGAGVALAFSFTACNSSDKSPTVTPTPTPPTRAEVTFRLDPPTVTANNEGGGQYAFKVNLEFFDTAGVGFTINTIRVTITTAGGAVVLDDTAAFNQTQPAFGRYVTQLTVRFNTGGPRMALLTRFAASITDANGNAITANAQVNVLQHGAPQRLP